MAESQQFGDCTDHRALGARGLVAQSISSELQRLVMTTEHLILGDWSPSLSTWNFKDCTDHRALDARGLVAQSISSELQNIAPTTECSMLGDWSYSIAMQNSKERTWCLGTDRHTIVHLGTGRSVHLIANELVNLGF